MKKVLTCCTIKRRFKRLLLITRIAILISSLSLPAVHASVYSPVNITLELHNVTLFEVLKEVKNQTDYTFLYRSDNIENFKIESVVITNEPISKLLDDILLHRGYEYEIIDKTIVIRKKVDSSSKKKQPILAKGKVLDADGNPLIGVNVVIEGTMTGTVTDRNGDFQIEVPDKNTTLVFSYIGYAKQHIKYSGKELTVMLEENVEMLDEIVVIGYGTQKKVNITGAVDVITNEQLESRQSPTVSQLLQGQSPGLDFSVGNFGFQPGAEVDLDIRGMGSLNGGAPYVLIDGFPGDMNRLNPDDIESVSILKDAAASAIYGARAPYGVILITTKAGKKNERLSVTYSSSVSVNTPQRLPDMPDSYTFARVMNEAGLNQGAPLFRNDVIDRIQAYQNEDWEYIQQFLPEDATHFETVPQLNGMWAQRENSHSNNDWFDIMYGNSINQRHNFSAKGGSEKTSFYFSAGYIDQHGVLNYGEDKYDRLNVSAKINTAITDWWDFRYEPRFMKSNRIYPNSATGGSSNSYVLMFHQIARNYPTSTIYDGYGNITVQSKIPYLTDAGSNSTEVTENWHTFSTEIRPLKGWKIYGDFAYQSEDRFRSNVSLTLYDHLVDKSLAVVGRTYPSNVTNFQYSNYYWTTNAYTSYDLSLKEMHNFHIMIGTQFEYDKFRSLRASRNDIIVNNVPSLETALGEAIIGENLNHWATEGYFARLTYNYKEKYLLESNVRYDGTSRFREGKRWGFFPSFSLGWVISKEGFWEPISPIVNTFKVRGSWGQLGNQNVSSYTDLELIPLQSGNLNWLFNYGDVRPVGYTSTPRLISPSLTWETATTKNIGANMAFFGQKLQFDFDWFERITTDMIGPAEARPGVLGADVPQANNATLQTRGWELSLRWKQAFNNSFSYFVNANLYDSRSHVTKYLNPTKILDTWYEGKEVGEIWGYTSNGLFKTQEELDEHLANVNQSFIFSTWNTGDVKYEDLNDDGKIDNGLNTRDDHGDLSIIGNTTPRYQYGLSAGFSFKGFDFSMLWKGTGQRDLFYNGFEANFIWGFMNSSQTSLFTNHLDYFRDDPGDEYVGRYIGDANINLDAKYPRPYLNPSANEKNRQPSTLYLLDGSYLRLQNIQIGYNLPGKLLNRVKLSNARIFFSGDNLFTFTNLPIGIDPIAIEGYRNSPGKTYGADRIYSFGLTLTY